MRNMSSSTRRQLIALAAGGLSLPTWAAEDVVLYAYHLKPPYLTSLSKREGLYFDLAEMLGLRMVGMHFRTEYLPRKRLESDLELGRLKGVVIGVNPSWFKDSERTRFHWTPAFMHDVDVVVSRHERPVEYTGPESLVGQHMALPRGYYYYGIDELVRAGRIQRQDTESEETALMMLVLGRADVTVITRRTLYSLLSVRPGLRGKLHVAGTPHDEFDRHILVPKELAHLHKPLSDAVLALVKEPAWQTRLLER